MSITSEYKNSERQRRQLNLQYITLLEGKSSETGNIIDTLPARRCIRRDNVTIAMGGEGIVDDNAKWTGNRRTSSDVGLCF